MRITRGELRTSTIVLEMLEAKLAINLSEILKLLEKLEKLKEQITEAVQSEQDKKRRKKMLAALERGDLAALRSMLYD